MKFGIVIFFGLLNFSLFGASKVTILGTAVNHVGKTIEFFEIQDYISMREVLIASTNVQNDSTFKVSFSNNDYRQIVMRIDNESAKLYVQNDATYRLILKGVLNTKGELEVQKVAYGNDLIFDFVRLEKSDINYKILDYANWEYAFLSKNNSQKNGKTISFAMNLDTFKTKVEAFYKNDTCNFFKEHVAFSIAALDNLFFVGSRNKYEKYDNFIKYAPVTYNSEAYMDYIKSFYKKYILSVSNEINQRIYEAILASSPKRMMEAMGTDYCTKNMKLREIIMIRSLSEIYYNKEYPQANILTIIDSVAKFAMFEKNKVIAANVFNRLTELKIGVLAPEIAFITLKKDMRTWSNFKGKHLYICFLDPQAEESQRELKLLLALNKKYAKYVNFVTIIKATNDTLPALFKDIPWESHIMTEFSDFEKKFKINSYPQFFLLDTENVIVQSPAYKPSPDNNGRSIDQTFFGIASTIEAIKKKENGGR